jgi:hypothetical protein
MKALYESDTSSGYKKWDSVRMKLDRILEAPATAPAPTQLRQGECWHESTMAQWDYYRKLIAEGDTSSAPRDWFESLAETRLIAAPNQPNPYDACESFKAYQLACRREAVLQKENERLRENAERTPAGGQATTRWKFLILWAVSLVAALNGVFLMSEALWSNKFAGLLFNTTLPFIGAMVATFRAEEKL